MNTRAHATLAAPGDAVIEGFPIGKWLETKRAQDRKSGLDPTRTEALDALVEGEPWNPPHWPVSWQRLLTYNDLLGHTVSSGFARHGAVPGAGAARRRDRRVRHTLPGWLADTWAADPPPIARAGAPI
ncbi:helicase associated domain-containing protein [Embleya sp. NPDC005575]|uniref:helicase associated domain-containing protein n=1 Tax=Embleya sp. NPDC005575 TaxID=3156892 RepID=UPI0033B9249A